MWLISPRGKVRVLWKLPLFYKISELRFSPDGAEVLALGANWLWRSNITTGRTVRFMRPGSGPLESEFNLPKPEQQVWVNSEQYGMKQQGAALSPDGRFIIGYATNVLTFSDSEFAEPLKAPGCFSDLLVFDAHTGQIVRRIATPRIAKHTASDFKVWFSGDGQTMLAQGPYWNNALAVRLRDWKIVGTFPWTTDDLYPRSVIEPRVFSPDGR